MIYTIYRYKKKHNFVPIYIIFPVNLLNLCRMIYTINRVLFARKLEICRLKNPRVIELNIQKKVLILHDKSHNF